MLINSHCDLIVWNKAMDLAVCAHTISKRFPAREVYGLTSQVNRASVSVPANIAEGHARPTTRDFIHFLGIARGSLMELQTLLLLAVRLGYAREEGVLTAFGLITEVNKMLIALRRRLAER